MSIRKPLIGFSLFAVIALLLTWVIWATLQRGVDGETNSYSATFTDVLGLKAGDDVRMAGVRVGRVDKIELTGENLAKVDFAVQSDQEIFRNTRALVRYQNLIGQRYVALDDPRDKKTDQPIGERTPLESGGEIPLEQTEPSFDVSALLGGLQPLFEVLQPDQINSLSETFIQALQGDQVSLSGFLTQAAALATTFNDRDALLTDVINNLSGVVNGLAARSGQFETLLAQTRTLVAGLYVQGQELQGSTVRIADATTSLVGLVDKVRPTLDRAQDSTTQALNLLLAAGPKMDQLAYDGPAVLTDLARTTSEGGWITLYPCLLDVSLYGVLFPRNLWTQVGGNAHSEVCR